MVLKWLSQQETSARTLANQSDLRTLVERLVKASRSTTANAIENIKEDQLLAEEIEQEIAPTLVNYEFSGYLITDSKHQVLATSHKDLLGKTVDEYETLLAKVFDNKPTVSPPFSSRAAIPDKTGKSRTGVPTMLVSVPILNKDLQIIAALSLRIRPEREFTRLIQLGRIGNSGETYAVDRSGTMVSGSRFDEALILTGILPDRDGAESILNVQLKDPGGNMSKGFRPKARRAELAFTKAAAQLLEEKDGMDIVGYRDYRGVPVVGVWTWLKDYSFGLVTEIDYDEAFEQIGRAHV